MVRFAVKKARHGRRKSGCLNIKEMKKSKLLCRLFSSPQNFHCKHQSLGKHPKVIVGKRNGPHWCGFVFNEQRSWAANVSWMLQIPSSNQSFNHWIDLWSKSNIQSPQNKSTMSSNHLIIQITYCNQMNVACRSKSIIIQIMDESSQVLSLFCLLMFRPLVPRFYFIFFYFFFWWVMSPIPDCVRLDGIIDSANLWHVAKVSCKSPDQMWLVLIPR